MYCRALLVFLLLWQNPIRTVHVLCSPLLFFDAYKSDLKNTPLWHFSSPQQQQHESYYATMASMYFGFRSEISVFSGDMHVDQSHLLFSSNDGTSNSISNSISRGGEESQATLTLFTYVYLLERLLAFIGLNGMHMAACMCVCLYIPMYIYIYEYS